MLRWLVGNKLSMTKKEVAWINFRFYPGIYLENRGKPRKTYLWTNSRTHDLQNTKQEFWSLYSDVRLLEEVIVVHLEVLYLPSLGGTDENLVKSHKIVFPDEMRVVDTPNKM
jgi:hypothetical protein